MVFYLMRPLGWIRVSFSVKLKYYNTQKNKDKKRNYNTHPEQNIIETNYSFHYWSSRILEVTAQNRLEDEAIGGVVVNARDITERLQAQAAIRETEEQFRVAREIQQHLFPKEAPEVKGFDIAGASRSAAATGAEGGRASRAPAASGDRGGIGAEEDLPPCASSPRSTMVIWCRRQRRR